MATINLPPKTGDTIKHLPSGETWVVAAYELATRSVMPCGWPLGYAKIDDCEVIERCSEEEHVKLLKELAAMQPDGRDHDPRKSHALAQLVEMKVPGYTLPCPLCGNPKGAGRVDEPGEKVRWCCAGVELRVTQLALIEVREMIDSWVGRDIRHDVLERFDKILDEAGVGICTDL